MGLAEPKRKVKYSIDPNALHWANNDNKFGLKLMEKMGWEKGKGLGVKEDGITENIKVKFKTDNKGVGYSKNDYDNVWMDHQDDFESLLANLKNGHKEQESTSSETASATVQSLELKSKHSRARLHYKKFAKSKDLSTVSQNDLSCILGSQKRKSSIVATTSSAAATNEDESSSEDLRPGFGLGNPIKNSSSDDVVVANKAETTTQPTSLPFSTNVLSIGDYFAQKMAAKKRALAESAGQSTVEQPKEVVVESIVEESIEMDGNDEQIADESTTKKKRSKPKHLKTKDRQLKKLMKKSFKGSNFFDINGYSSYVINMSIEEALKEKQKLISRKQTQLEKNLEKDPEFYNMNKKINC